MRRECSAESEMNNAGSFAEKIKHTARLDAAYTGVSAYQLAAANHVWVAGCSLPHTVFRELLAVFSNFLII